MPSPSDITFSTVAKADADCPRNDTASVLQLRDGRLMVVWHKYSASVHSGSDFGVCRIHSKISTDGGLTWDSERMLVDVAPGDLNVQAPALCRLPSGNILLACMRAHARNSSTMVVFASADEGESFSEISRVWEHSAGQWLQGGASSLVLLGNGRLLLPFHGGSGDQGSQHNTARCAISDDAGYTWRFSTGIVDLPMRGAMEASVAELPTGRLVMSLRTQLGSVFLSHSDDGGETWSLAQTTGLRAPESCTCLRLIPGTGDLMLFWNDSPYNPMVHHYGDRTPLSAAKSTDGGITWQRWGVVDRGPHEFTNLGCEFISDGAAVVTYMRSPHAGEGRVFNRNRIDLLAARIEHRWFVE